MQINEFESVNRNNKTDWKLDWTQTINHQRAVDILGYRASYARALSSVERILGHFLWDLLVGPMNVTIKIDFVT